MIGDVCLSKKDITSDDPLALYLSVPDYVRIEHVQATSDAGRVSERWLRNTFDPDVAIALSPEMFDVLLEADGRRSLSELFHRAGVSEGRREACLAEVLELWARRSVVLRPAVVS